MTGGTADEVLPHRQPRGGGDVGANGSAAGKTPGRPRRAEAGLGGHLAELGQGRPRSPKDRPNLLTRFLADALRAGGKLVEGHGAYSRYRLEEKIGRVRCPTLVRCGTEDPSAFPRRISSRDTSRGGGSHRSSGGRSRSWARCRRRSLSSYSSSSGDSGVESAVPRGPGQGQSRVSMSAPATTRAAPVSTLTRGPPGTIFSSITRIVRAPIQTRFITPATNSRAIRAQQHPTQ